jgi:hypothetical protein
VVKGRHEIGGDFCRFLTSASLLSMNRRRYYRERRNFELPVSWNIAPAQDVIAKGSFITMFDYFIDLGRQLKLL